MSTINGLGITVATLPQTSYGTNREPVHKPNGGDWDIAGRWHYKPGRG